MSFAFVFPPRASPAYIPLGLGILTGLARARNSGRPVRLVDLNIEAWEHAASGIREGDSLLGFMRGREGDFFDRESYRRNAERWLDVKRAMDALAAGAELYVESGTLGGPFGDLLARQVETIAPLVPETIGISVLFPGQLVFALALARRLHGETAAVRSGSGTAPGRTTGPRIVLGGAALSYIETRDLLAACPYVDGVVLGEGEAAAAALLDVPPVGDIPGYVTRRNGRASRRPSPCSVPIDGLPPADFRDLDLARYLAPEPVLPFLTSRGCRWRRCRFCAHNLSFAPFHRRSPEMVADELELQQRRHGVRHFYFADPYADEAHLAEVAAAVVKRGLDIRFHVMGRPVAAIDEGYLGLLSRAGCRWISWGIESGSQRLLDLARKDTRVGQIRRVLASSHAAGISNLLLMLFGLPGGTDRDLQDTIELLDDVWDLIDSVTASSFTLYADAPFGRRPQRYGLHVLGKEVLLRAGGRPVRWRRFAYRETSDDGMPRPPRGALEVSVWNRHRRWLEERPFDDLLFAEHYLLHAAKRHEIRNRDAPDPDLIRVS